MEIASQIDGKRPEPEGSPKMTEMAEHLKHMAVGSQAVHHYRTFQADESKLLICDFLLDPDDFVLAIERYCVSVTSIIGCGRRIDRKNDYVAQQALKMMEGVDFVIPGVFLKEAVPAMLKLPAVIYKLPSALRLFAAVGCRQFYMLIQEGARARKDNFAKYMLNAQEKHGMADVEVPGLMAKLIGGGVDTTSSTHDQLYSCHDMLSSSSEKSPRGARCCGWKQ